MKLRYILIFLCFGLLVNCGDDDGNECSPYQTATNFDTDVEADNIATIEQYLLDNNLVAEKTADNLYYIINEPGSLDKPTICNTVVASYKGYLPNGTVFDMSDEMGIAFPLSNVVKGWQEGIPLLGKDGSAVLLIPSKLGYGTSPPFNSGIPENSVLIFDVTLLGF